MIFSWKKSRKHISKWGLLDSAAFEMSRQKPHCPTPFFCSLGHHIFAKWTAYSKPKRDFVISMKINLTLGKPVPILGWHPPFSRKYWKFLSTRKANSPTRLNSVEIMKRILSYVFLCEMQSGWGTFTIIFSPRGGPDCISHRKTLDNIDSNDFNEFYEMCPDHWL